MAQANVPPTRGQIMWCLRTPWDKSDTTTPTGIFDDTYKSGPHTGYMDAHGNSLYLTKRKLQKALTGRKYKLAKAQQNRKRKAPSTPAKGTSGAQQTPTAPTKKRRTKKGKWITKAKASTPAASAATATASAATAPPAGAATATASAANPPAYMVIRHIKKCIQEKGKVMCSGSEWYYVMYVKGDLKLSKFKMNDNGDVHPSSPVVRTIKGMFSTEHMDLMRDTLRVQFEDSGTWKDMDTDTALKIMSGATQYKTSNWAYELTLNNNELVQKNIGANTGGGIDTSRATGVVRKIRIISLWEQEKQRRMQSKFPEFPQHLCEEVEEDKACDEIKEAVRLLSQNTRLYNLRLYTTENNPMLSSDVFDAMTNRLKNAQQACNHVYAAHGTSFTSVPKILAQGFENPGNTQSGVAQYGRGTYAEDLEKSTDPGQWCLSNRYSHPNTHGRKAVLLLRVIEGKRCSTNGGCTMLTHGYITGGNDNKSVIMKPFTRVHTDMHIMGVATFNM